jgi:hypothetical protein
MLLLGLALTSTSPLAMLRHTIAPASGMLSGARLRQPFGRQLPVDGADDALVQGFLHTMAARPGICFECAKSALL